MTSELRAAIAEMEQTCDSGRHVSELAGGPLRIQVVTAHPALSDALATALAPGLLAVDRSEDQALAADGETVRIAVEPGLVARLSRLAGSDRTVSSGGTQAIATGTGQADGLVCWHRDTPQVTRLLLTNAGSSGQRTAVRAVRAVAERALLAAGWTPLHAACAWLPDRGTVVLLGPPGAGKTTTLLHLLAARPPAALVANSALFVIERTPRFRARALPASVAMRPATARAFPLLEAALATLLQAAPPEHHGIRASADERLLLSPAGLARCFGTTLVPEVDIAAIVAVDHHDETAPEWRHATAGEARALLEAAYPEPWLPDASYETNRLAASAELRPGHARLLDRLALGVPYAVLRPGADPADALQRGLDRLLA